MSELLQVLVSGTAIGCIYALIGLGFLFSVNGVRLINLAHGEVLMVGAFLAVSGVQALKLPLLAAYTLAVAGTMALGYLLQQIILQPLIGKPFFTVLVATLGLSMVMSNAAMNLWTSETVSLPGPFGTAVVRLGEVVVAQQSLLIMAVTGVVLALQGWFFRGTLTGRQMRAMADRPDVARLLGIPVRRLTALTFIISAGLAGLAGVLLGPLYFVSYHMGGIALIKGFTAMIVGGFGRVDGVMMGGIVLGVVETLMAAYVSAAFKDGFAFLLLILVLLVRPQGILGERAAERL